MNIDKDAPVAAAVGSGPLPLSGKSALVTGVSRRKGIGFAVAVRLAELGASVHIQHFAPHDRSQPWGSDDLDAVRAGVRACLSPGAGFGDTSADLADADTLAPLMAAARELTGRVDVLVCNHARAGGDGSLFDMTPERLDGHWQVNTRSTILLTKLFAEQYSGSPDDDGAVRPGERRAGTVVDEHATGRVFWMTSGQQQGPMPGEVAYAASKAALAGLTATVASELLPRAVILNTINPGPVDTGYLDPDVTDRPLDDLLEHIAGTPFRRFGAPTDPARLIGWLATDDARWIVGQVITSDGGFALA